MLNLIMIIIGFTFALKGYYAFEEIYPNKTHAAFAVVVLIALYKLTKELRRNNDPNN